MYYRFTNSDEVIMADAVIEQLTEATSEAAEQINKLLPQLTTKPAETMDLDRLGRVLADPGAIYVGRLDGVIVGIIQRVDVTHLVRMKSWIEDYVVDESARGHGLATRLLQTAIAGAPLESASINLTSKQVREDSHRLYRKLGFSLREESSLWRLTLPVSAEPTV